MTQKIISNTRSHCCYAIIKTSFIGFHRWQQAPPEVKYLSNPHRHRFFVTCYIQQYHLDRDIEYHLFQSWLDNLISKSKDTINSCEMFAEYLLEIIKKDYPGRWVRVEVNEDNEVGAIVEDYEI